MIVLNKTLLIAKGQRCLVYCHPQDNQLLIKVLNPQFCRKNSFKTRLLKRIPTIHRYRLSKCYIRELIESVRLRFNDNYSPPSCLQQVTGIVDTNLGPGMVVWAERGRDGHYAQTLKHLIQTGQFNDPMQKKLNEFYQQLAHCDVAVSDTVPRNLVYAYDETIGDHFVLIDGIGEKTLVPYLRLSAYLRKKIRLRQIKLLKKRVTASLHKMDADCRRSF